MADEFDQYKRKAPDEDFSQYKRQPARPDFSQNPPGLPPSHIQMHYDPLGAEPGGMPGVSEGAGLAEGLAEYDKASGGQIASGISDIAHGGVARGTHKIVSGGTNALAPVAALTAPGMIAAPITTGAIFGGGYLGGKIAHGAAEHLGATPDQADVAGDIGGILGGTAGGILGHQIPGKIQSAPVRLASRTAEAVANQKFAPVRPIFNLMTPADEAAKVAVKFPGRDVGLPPSPEYPGAKFPARVPQKELIANRGIYPGANLPENPGAAKLAQNAANPAEGVSSPSYNLRKNLIIPDEATAQSIDRLDTAAGPRAEFFGRQSAARMPMGKGPIVMKGGMEIPGTPPSSILSPIESGPKSSIPGKPTVVPSPSSNAYLKSAPPAGTVIPEGDMTEILKKSLPNAEPMEEFERRGASRDISEQVKTERMNRARQIIHDPQSTYEQRVQSMKDLQDATLGQTKPTDLAAREQAGKTRNMSQPRKEFEAPTSTRKDLNLSEEDFLNARKRQRTKSGG